MLNLEERKGMTHADRLGTSEKKTAFGAGAGRSQLVRRSVFDPPYSLGSILLSMSSSEFATAIVVMSAE
jgi:hypothetical protein